MGTRALIHIKDEEQTVLTIYRQMDGYPEGLGQEIKDILNGGDCKIVNGYKMTDKTPKAFNGMGCLAAFLLGNLKLKPYGDTERNAIGSVYIYPPNTSDVGEEYVYTVRNNNGQVYLEVTSFDGSHYNGPLADFIPTGFGIEE